jgi:hypothetical protein
VVTPAPPLPEKMMIRMVKRLDDSTDGHDFGVVAGGFEARLYGGV